jgi:hypothetical protein
MRQVLRTRSQPFPIIHLSCDQCFSNDTLTASDDSFAALADVYQEFVLCGWILDVVLDGQGYDFCSVECVREFEGRNRDVY